MKGAGAARGCLEAVLFLGAAACLLILTGAALMLIFD